MSLSPRLLKLPTPENCQFKPTVPMKRGAGDLIVADVVDLDSAGIEVAQDHVGFAEAAEIAEAHDLPIQCRPCPGRRRW